MKRFLYTLLVLVFVSVPFLLKVALRLRQQLLKKAINEAAPGERYEVLMWSAVSVLSEKSFRRLPIHSMKPRINTHQYPVSGHTTITPN